MKCVKAKSLFSPHLDGQLEGGKRREVQEHLSSCTTCNSDYALLVDAARSLRAVGRKQAPSDLALRVKLALSREAAKAQQSPWETIRFRLENAVRASMVPATAGVVSAVVIFGLLIGFFVLPAQSNDVPTMLYTPPELAVSPFGLSDNVSAESVVIEAYVDANGRVQDYRVLSSTKSSQVTESDLKNMLIFTTFRPATSFGRPTAGRAVLTFSKINVRG